MTQEMLAGLKARLREYGDYVSTLGPYQDEKMLRAAVVEYNSIQRIINQLKTGFYLLDHEIAKKIRDAVKEQPTTQQQ